MLARIKHSAVTLEIVWPPIWAFKLLPLPFVECDTEYHVLYSSTGAVLRTAADLEGDND